MTHENEKFVILYRSHDLYRPRAAGEVVKLRRMVEFVLVVVTCRSIFNRMLFIATLYKHLAFTDEYLDEWENI